MAGRQSITRQTQRRAAIHTHIHTSEQFRLTSKVNPHVCGLWEETECLEETDPGTGEQANSTQKGRIGLAGLNFEPPCCEVTVLTITTLFHLVMIQWMLTSLLHHSYISMHTEALCNER